MTAISATGKVSSRVAGRTTSGAAASGNARGSTRLASLRSFKMRYLLEQVEALFNLFARDRLQPFGSKPLDGERSHHTAVEHRFAEDGRRQLRLRCDVAIKTAGEGVPRPGGINHFRQRHGRCTARSRNLS